MKAGVLGPMTELLNYPQKSIKKESAWVMSNIAAGPEETVGECLKSGLFEKLVENMNTEDINIKIETMWAISNLT